MDRQRIGQFRGLFGFHEAVFMWNRMGPFEILSQDLLLLKKNSLKMHLMNNMIPDYKKSRMILNLFLDR